MMRSLFSGILLLTAGCSSTPAAGADAGDGAAPTNEGGQAPEASAPAAWPGPSNTGVPPGTTLTPYTDSCVITVDGTVIDSKTVNCDISIQAANVMIKNTKVNGRVALDADQPSSKQWSFTIQDSEVDAGAVQLSAVSDGNMTVLRCNLYGGENEVHCSENALTCTVQDSWLHGQYLPDDQPWHLGGFQSNGGTNIVVRHNTIVCDHAANSLGEGCTGDLNLIPDFAPVSGATIDSNFFGANLGSAYCTYGGEKSTSQYPHADHVVYTNNVFQRGSNSLCAAYGPVTGFDINGVGNQWINNTWEDGTVVPPEN